MVNILSGIGVPLTCELVGACIFGSRGTYRDESGPMGFPAAAEGKSAKIAKMEATPVKIVCAPGPEGDRIVKVASGTDHTLALTRGGAVISWGCGAQVFTDTLSHLSK